ncbi:hypothetical protein KOW79_017036 [Hemibagrus wyckioides]|uniref:Uncharacterized protein n=1 Tax=Hemibagrus wyckioides TaxID=337641 RepID=A0A9D3SHS2_9TELE|nr:hypothetical protein KOW79_017036 [Hemibagrus wyckioides]
MLHSAVTRIIAVEARGCGPARRPVASGGFRTYSHSRFIESGRGPTLFIIGGGRAQDATAHIHLPSVSHLPPETESRITPELVCRLTATQLLRLRATQQTDHSSSSHRPSPPSWRGPPVSE